VAVYIAGQMTTPTGKAAFGLWLQHLGSLLVFSVFSA